MSPDEFLKLSYEYFDWCDNNPIIRNEAIKSGDLAGSTMQVEVPRPYTKIGLKTFLNIDNQTLANYRSNEPTYAKYFENATHVIGIIESYQMEGGLAGELSQTLVAKLHDLQDKVQIDHDITSKGEKISLNVNFKNFK